MLLKFKSIRYKYSIGLRWAVDTRRGIEMIARETGLTYGFITDLKSKANKKLKSFALTQYDHDKTISLAGIFSKKFENVILVHRLNDYYYWLCVIVGGEVWSGIDVVKATSGDFVGDLGRVKSLIEVAQEDLKARGVDIETACMCTDAAVEEFPDFQVAPFIEMIVEATKNRRPFTVKYLEPTAAILKKIGLLITILAVIGGSVYFIHSRKLASQLLHQKQIEQAKERAARIAARNNYFIGLQRKLQQDWAYAVIGDLMQEFSHISMQSKGWTLDQMTYDISHPSRLEVSLSRSSYGTADSFFYAFTPDGQDGTLSKNSDNGDKRLQLVNFRIIPTYATPVPVSTLLQKVSKNYYKLISYMQISGQDFTFNAGALKTSKYGVKSAEVTISGNSLWKLKKLQGMARDFNTFVVTSVSFEVVDYDMSWELRGEIYA